MTTLLRDLIDIPDRVLAGDFVLALARGINEPSTIDQYVVTEQLAGSFDRALGIIQTAVETGEFHVGTRGMKRNCLAYTHQTHALVKFAVEMNSSLYVLHRHFLSFPLQSHVAFYVREVAGTPVQIQQDVSCLIADVHLAMAVRHLEIRCEISDGYIAAGGRDSKGRVLRNVDIHVSADAFVARALRVGVQSYDFISDDDLRLRFGVVIVRVLLFFGAYFFAHRDFHGLAFGDVNRDRAAIVIHMQRTAGRNVLAQFVAVIKS